MVTTKYSSVTFALLLAGIAVALLDGWLAAMTAGFGTDPVHDLKSGAFMVVLWASLAILAASIVTLRWAKLGAIISWSVVALCCLSVWASPAVLLFLVLAGVQGLITTNIAARSERALSISVIPK